jgi:Domain of unknown function (DUF3291)
MHLAELNIARLKYPLDDPRVAEFADNLARVNAVADRSDGFVWRLQDDSGDATSIHAFDDPMVIVNMTVWQSAEHLERFVWNTVHKQFYAKRAEWFELMQAQHFVMWWVDEGHVPDLAEAKARLDHLDANGDSDFAFGWSHLPHVKLWQQARCA